MRPLRTTDKLVKNIDTALHPLLYLSMYPVQDQQIYQIMEKDYSTFKYPLYERQGNSI